jgi:hypothetical protein
MTPDHADEVIGVSAPIQEGDRFRDWLVQPVKTGLRQVSKAFFSNMNKRCPAVSKSKPVFEVIQAGETSARCSRHRIFAVRR